MAKTAAKRAIEQKSIPTTMKAAALDQFGPSSVLTLHELPVPKLDPNDVLIALDSAGVGVWDDSVRDGSWNPWGQAKFPLIPGMDGAGTIVQKGPRVKRFEVGDAVWAAHYANPKGGFYAEFVAIDAEYVCERPAALSPLEAGAAVVTGLTALQGVSQRLHLRAGQTILIFGASGGVGTLAVQFAKLLNARVAGTASGRAAQAIVRHLGADLVIDARSEDTAEKLKEFAPDGLDVVLALAGGDSLERCLDCVRNGGKVAYPNGVEPQPRQKEGLTLLAYDSESGYRPLSELKQAAQDAKLQVPIPETFPLAEAKKAHEKLEEGHILGRIALQIRR